ncbi:hypothetical protein SDC9_146541 [bioreactor metagenome]|uniref:Uncharacterized protein n=1 Tax=bioreactor metagenome TaxID=1076179 RepID=A0A645EBY2_9ZZZZ
MVTAFAIFRFVIDHAVFHFHFANGIIALEVVAIVHGIPQAKLNGRKDGKFGGFGSFVAELQRPDFKVLALGHEITRF